MAAARTGAGPAPVGTSERTSAAVSARSHCASAESPGTAARAASASIALATVVGARPSRRRTTRRSWRPSA